MAKLATSYCMHTGRDHAPVVHTYMYMYIYICTSKTLSKCKKSDIINFIYWSSWLVVLVSLCVFVLQDLKLDCRSCSQLQYELCTSSASDDAGVILYRPVQLSEVFKIMSTHSDKAVFLVAGNTGKGQCIVCFGIISFLYHYYMYIVHTCAQTLYILCRNFRVWKFNHYTSQLPWIEKLLWLIIIAITQQYQ